MSKDDAISQFHEYGLHVPSRTIMLQLDSDDNEVNHNAADRVIKNLHILELLDHTPIRVYLNCPGGSVTDGMAIYDAILACTSRITGLVLGEASSMGALILQAFDRRIAYKWSRFMLHDGENSVSGNWRDVEKAVESDRLFRLDSYRILAEATGKPAKYWQRKLANDYYLNAQQALEENLIDEIL